VANPIVKNRPSKSKQLNGGLNVVALGGGTGLSTLLRGLKDLVARRRDDVGDGHPISGLTAIVTVTDDGGSSGRLRRENRILPPGDIRNCMVALGQDEALLGRLFQYRFHAGRGRVGPQLGNNLRAAHNRLIGHNFGNLFLAALTHVTGDFAEAVRVSSKILAIRGQIFPSTISNVSLVATLEDGRRVHGETKITASRKRIKKLALNPRSARALPKALEAIKEADLILLGPGSLYTSILPNLLIPEIAQAVAASKAPRVYIANLMTQPGETSGYALADHLTAIRQHTSRRVIDWVVANRQSVSREVAKRYRAQGAEPVAVNLFELQKLGYRVILDNLLEEHGVLRHNPQALAQLLFEEFLSLPRRFVKPAAR
jgi:uncharacterized cofD-like protein